MNFRLKQNFFARKFSSHTRELLHGALVAFILKVTGAGLQFLFNIVLARLLGAEGTGQYFIAFALTSLASVVGRFGLDQAMVRFVAAAASIENWQAIKGLAKRAVYTSSLASALSATFLFFAAPFICQNIFGKPELLLPLRIMSLAVVPFSLMMIHVEMLRGLKKIRDSQIVQAVMAPGLTLVGVFIFTRWWGVSGAASAYAVSVVLAMLISRCLWRSYVEKFPDNEGPAFDEDLISTSMPLMWTSSMFVISGWISTLMLGGLLDASQVGIFNAANRTALLTSLVLVSVNSISSPKFSAFHKKSELDDLRKMVVHSTRLIFLTASPIIAVFFLFPEWVLSFFGEEFQSGASLLRILAFGQFINVATGSAGQIMVMTGHEKSLRNIITSSTVLSITLNYILIKQLGVLGAAFAVFSTVAYISIVATMYVAKKIGIHSHIFVFKRYKMT